MCGGCGLLVVVDDGVRQREAVRLMVPIVVLIIVVLIIVALTMCGANRGADGDGISCGAICGTDLGLIVMLGNLIDTSQGLKHANRKYLAAAWLSSHGCLRSHPRLRRCYIFYDIFYDDGAWPCPGALDVAHIM